MARIAGKNQQKEQSVYRKDEWMMDGYWTWGRRGIRCAAIGVGISLFPFPVMAQQSPEFAYSAEKWAALRDDRLEYEEIADLVHEYNNTVLQNAIDFQDQKDKDRNDVAEDYYNTANDIYNSIQYPSSDDSDYGSRMASVLNSRLQAEQLMEQGDESTEDSETVKIGYDQAEANLVKQAQGMMIDYWSQYYSLDSLRQRKQQAEKDYQSEENRLGAGMSTQAKVLTAREAISSAEASLLTAESNLTKTKDSLCLMLGWQYGANVEMGELPEPDFQWMEGINVEEDIQKAWENNYNLRLTQKRLANARTDKVKNTLEQTRKNQRESIAVHVKDSYSTMILAQSNYEQALQAFEMAKTSMDSARRKLDAGIITPNAFQSEQSSYETAQVATQTQKAALLKAMVNYQWAVDGLAETS